MTWILPKRKKEFNIFTYESYNAMSLHRQAITAICLSKPQSSPQDEEKLPKLTSWIRSTVILMLMLTAPIIGHADADREGLVDYEPMIYSCFIENSSQLIGVGVFDLKWMHFFSQTNTNTTATQALGGSTISDLVWLDCDQDGIIDAGEEGIRDVPVTLTGTNVFNEIINETTLTDEFGAYAFNNLEAGDYQVTFGLPLTASGLDFTAQEEGTDIEVDSDPDPSTGVTPVFVVENNKLVNTIDAGLKDIESPQLNGVPDDITSDCNTIPDPPVIYTDITATDNWSQDVVITLSTSSTQGTSNECSLYNYLIIRTWSADDECGNSIADVQIITVKDILPPSLVDVPDNITVDPGQGEVIPPVATVTATDDCDPNVTIAIDEEDIPGANCGFVRVRTWTATDACGNQTVDQQEITVMSLGGGGNASSNSPVCGGDDLLLFADGGTTYSWTGPGGFSSNLQNPIITSANPLNAGNYTVEISDGTCTETIVVNVAVAAELDINPNIINANCINKGRIFLSVSGGSSPFNFDWADLPGNNDPFNRIDLNPGIYKVTVTDNNGCTIVDDNIEVVDNCGCNADAGSITPEAALYCASGSQLIAAVPAGNSVVPNGFSTLYVLTSGTGLIIEQVSTIPQFVVATTGFYTIHTLVFNPLTLDPTISVVPGVTSGFDINSMLIQGGGSICGALDVAGAQINVSSAVDATIASTFPASCGVANGMAVLSPAIYSYAWSDGGSGESRDDLSVGFYTVTVSNVDACTSTLNVNIIDNCSCEEPEVIDILTFGSNCGQAYGSAAITVQGNPADYIFTWTPDNGTPNATNNIRTDLVAGAYKVKIANPIFADCSIEVNLVISNEDGPEVSSISTTPASCSASNGSATLLPDVHTYAWAFDSFQGNTRNDLPAGVYEVYVFDQTVPPCPSAILVEILEQNTLQIDPVVNAAPDCNQSNGSVTLNVSGGSGNYTYSWGADATRTDLSSGVYVVTVTDNANACAQSITFTLTDAVVGAQITIAPVFNTLCASSQDAQISYNLVLDPGFMGPESVSISDGIDTYGVNDLLGTGDYCLLVTDANGCLAAQSCFQVVEPDPIVVDVLLKDKECAQAGSVTLDVSGGNGGYTFDWNDLPGANDPQNRSDLQAGTFGVVITDVNGCSRTITGLNINDNCPFNCTNPEILSTLVVEATCGNSDGSITLEMQGNPTQFNYTWSPNIGFGDENIKRALPSGVYEVTVADAGDPSCSVSRTIVVGNSDGPQVTLLNSSPAFCARENGAAVLEPINFVYEWCNGVFGFNPTNLPAGNCTVTVTDPQTGCTNIVEVEIQELNLLDATPIIVAEPACNQANGTVDFQIVGGSSNYDIQWNDGGVGTPRTDLAAGVYTITVTDLGPDGCVATTTFALTEMVNADAQISLISSSPLFVSCAGDADASVDFQVNYDAGFQFPADTIITDGTNDYQNGTLGEGTYCILISDASGCLAAESCFEVESPESMDVVAAINQQTCTDDGTITIVVNGGSGGFTFDWEDIPGTNDGQNRTGLVAGVYNLTVTDLNTCQALAKNLIVVDECLACPNVETITEIIPVNSQDINCFQLESCFDQTLTTYVLLDGTTNGTSNLGLWTLDANGCLEYNSNAIPGLDTICVIAQFGTLSDTTCFVYDVFVTPTQAPENDTIYLTTIELNAVDSCLDISEIGGVFTSSSIFEMPINATGDLTITGNCVNYNPFAGSFGDFIDTMTVVICNDIIPSCDTTVIIVSVVSGPCQAIYTGADTLLADSCQGFARLCVDIPVIDFQDFTFVDNGMAFTGNFEPCVIDTSYQYVAAPLGAPGFFELLEWEVNGVVFTIPLFTTVDQLADSMMVWDPAGNWELFGFVIVGGAPGSDYGDLVITASGSPVPNIPAQVINDATALLLAPGTHNLIITDTVNVCVANFEVEVVCDTMMTPPPFDTLLTVVVGETDTICFPGLLPIVSVQNLCPGDNDGNAFVQAIFGTNCIEYSGILLGQDTFCLELCDGVICDTSIIVINVIPETETIPVFINVGITDTFCLDTTFFQNPIDTVYNFCESASGTFVDFELIDGTVCIEYTGLAVGAEQACLVVCDTAGFCDTTFLSVGVIQTTTEIIDTTIFVNDFDTICLNDFELLGSVDTFYNYCDRGSGLFVEFFLDADSLCVVYEGISPGLDSACLVICDEFGICDTTLLYVTAIPQIDSLPPVAVNDTVMTTSATSVDIQILLNDTINGNLLNIIILDQPLNGSVSSSAFDLVYLPDPGFCDGVDSFKYAIQNEVGWDTATVIIEIMCTDLNIFTGFSPNGDNINETWIILGIERFPNNTVKVYNRWGNLVYEELGYTNNNGWDGSWNSQPLPDGTYFYIVTDGESQTFNGYLQIQR